MEDRLSECELETPSVVAAETGGLLAPSRARAQVWPPYLGGKFPQSSGSLPLLLPSADGHTLTCSKQVPKRGRVSPFQTPAGAMPGSWGAIPSGHQPVTGLDAAYCLPSPFDPGIAKPLTYSASLVVSEGWL